MPRSAPLLVLASLAACTPVLHAPPARLFPARPPSRVDPGRVEVHFAGTAQLGLFTARVVGAELGISYGFEPDWVFEGEALVVSVSDSRDGDAFAATRFGLRHRVNDALDLTAGLGIGAAGRAGPYAALDAGLSFGWVNPYVTPYLALGLGVATPFWDPPEVRLEIDTDERTETIVGAMQPGLHVRASGGLEFASGATFSPRLQIDATFLETIGEPPGLFRGDSWLLGASVGVRFSGTTEPSRRERTGRLTGDGVTGDVPPPL